MKIAYISHHSRPCYEYNWFSHLNVEKIKFIDVDFSAYPKNKDENKIEYCQVDYTENKLFKNRFHSTASLIEYHNFEKYLEDVDVIIVLEIFSSLSKQFIKYCKENSKKSVVIVYELIPTHPLHYLPTHILNRLYSVKYANLFVCVSQKAKDSLIKLGVDEQKAEVVYPGIDLNIFKLDATKIYNKNILFVGGLKEHKGIDLFLQVADELLKDTNEIKFGVVGDGTYKKKCLEYEKKYTNFKYFGRIPNESLPSILKDYSIYVMPCREVRRYGIKVTAEQFGFSFVEAMSCNLAVITTKCGAIPEIVTDNNIIVDQSNLNDLIIATKILLNDSNKLKEIGEKNSKLVEERYNIVKQGLMLTEILTKI